MYALVAAVVIATPAAYVVITTITVDRLVARESENTAALQIVRPLAMTARRPI